MEQVFITSAHVFNGLMPKYDVIDTWLQKLLQVHLVS